MCPHKRASDIFPIKFNRIVHSLCQIAHPERRPHTAPTSHQSPLGITHIPCSSPLESLFVDDELPAQKSRLRKKNAMIRTA